MTDIKVSPAVGNPSEAKQTIALLAAQQRIGLATLEAQVLKLEADLREARAEAAKWRSMFEGVNT